MIVTYVLNMQFVYTPWAIKTSHFVFDNNSGVSLSIFILFAPVEMGRNTLQFSYLMAWWHHNCITSHVTKVGFIQLLLQVKYVEFEDRPKFFCQKPVGMWKFFSQKADKRIFYQELEKKNIGQISVQVANNRFDQMHCDDWLQNVLFICRFSFTR